MQEFWCSLLRRLVAPAESGRRILAVDGVDGSGKTRFATELAAQITDRAVVIIHADDFLNPSAVRHAKGRTSADGFWMDTYNYAALSDLVLVPLGPGGDGWYTPAIRDVRTDRALTMDAIRASCDALVIVEGMFLHRDELMSNWDASVFLDVPFTVTAARMATRDGSNPDPEHPSMLRYVGGQRLYFQSAHPWDRATVVVDNSDFDTPTIIPPGHASSRRLGRIHP